jgi:hypothetical protein
MRVTIVVLFFCVLVIMSCRQSADDSKSIALFNGKDLQGWDTYVGPSFDTIGHKRDSVPLGLNNDTLKIFTVVTVDNQPALRVSGQRFGGISTKQAYENYHLTMEFKWGDARWPPRQDKKRDSGILYHAVGPQGADHGYWMRSQEFQVQEGDCADYWGVAGAVFDIPAREDSGKYTYDPKGTLLTFRAGGPQGRHCMKHPDNEKPTGEWNTVEIYCHGDTSVHMVNGVVSMVLYHSRQQDDGKDSPLTKGKLQIQSEGAEVFYRNIFLEPVDRIPPEIFKALF